MTYCGLNCDCQVFPSHNLFTQVCSSSGTPPAVRINEGYDLGSPQASSGRVHITVGLCYQFCVTRRMQKRRTG